MRGSRALYMLVLRKHEEIATKSHHIAKWSALHGKSWELGFGVASTKLCNSDADARDGMESDLEQQLRLVEQELHQVQGTHAISNLKINNLLLWFLKEKKII